MPKYIDADEFLLQYSILTSRPNFTPLSSEMSAWKLWKEEFDRDVVRLISRMVTEREEDEQKFIAKIKEIPLAQIPIDDIVRCKDCRFFEPVSDYSGNCYRNEINNIFDGYCNKAERRKSKVKRCFDIPKEVAEMMLEDTERRKSE